MTQGLASVYVNESRVGLEGDPKPKVAKIVKTVGHEPQMTQVFRLKERNDPKGTPLSLEETIDRTKEQQDVYLRCVDKSGTGPGAATKPGDYRTEAAMEFTTPETPTTGEFGGGSKPAPPTPPVPGRAGGAWRTGEKSSTEKAPGFGPGQYGGAGTNAPTGEKREHNPSNPTNPSNPNKNVNPNEKSEGAESNTDVKKRSEEKRREDQ